QPNPPTPSPFRRNIKYRDPFHPWELESAWAVSITTSLDIIIFGEHPYSRCEYRPECHETFRCCSIQFLPRLQPDLFGVCFVPTTNSERRSYILGVYLQPFD